jgi:Mrp family chromosome partitioning ATPase
MLGSKRMGQLIESLRREADIVIFDGAPILAVTDSIVLGAGVDGVLLVIEAGRTRYAQAQRSQEALTKVGAQVLGVVLNRVSERSENYYRYYDDGTDERQPRRVRFRWSLSELSTLRRRFGHSGAQRPAQGGRVINPQSIHSTSTEGQAESIK